jgi:uncharacterized membrane protein YphA (DoxX/SURF4 family)
MATAYGKANPVNEVRKSELNVEQAVTVSDSSTALRTVSATRILFGAIFLFDGILKWILIQQGTMQGVVQGSVLGTANPLYGSDFIANNWLAFGVLIGVGETLAGAALLLGIFQRPAALAGAGIMGFIWAYGGFGGFVWNGFWQSGFTDPGGDLMLALVFAVLVFAPAAYGLASRFHLRERLAGGTLGRKLARFLVA